ncbi:MAG: hypothetical protein GPJ54_22030 [Candidatus Heimdallarchaeota archaeon]|nr:hypothetical protein [Candidatus Heimdallarchaeota archaeon]
MPNKLYKALVVSNIYIDQSILMPKGYKINISQNGQTYQFFRKAKPIEIISENSLFKKKKLKSMRDLQSLLFLGKFEEADDIIQGYERSSTTYKLVTYYILIYKGAYKDVEQLLKEDSIKNYNTQEDQMAFLFVKGDIELKMRRLEEGMILVKQGLNLYHSSEVTSGNKLWYARLLVSEATYLAYLAEFNQSSERFQKALKIFQEYGDIIGILRCDSGLCASTYWLGEIDDSLNYGLQALSMYDKYETRVFYEIITNNLGLVYHSRNQPDLALKYFFLSEQVHQKTQNQLLLAVIYFNIIQSAVLKEDSSLAKIYFDKYSILDDQQSLIKLLSNISSAVTLGMTPRIKEKAKALSILEEIAREPVIDYQFTIFARYAHIDLLLEDFFAFGSLEIINRIEEIIDGLMETAEERGLQLVKVNTGLLKSRLLLIAGKFDEAKKLLQSSLVDADAKGMTTISEIVKLQLARINDEIPYWEDFKNQNTPLTDMIHNSGFKRLLKQVLNNRLYDILEDYIKPLFLIILQPSGMPLYTKRFEDSSDANYNEILISNLFAALEMFGKEVLSNDVSMDKLHFSDNVILSKKSIELTYVYAYNGEAGNPLIQLSKFSEEIEKIKTIKFINQQLAQGLPNLTALSRQTKSKIDEIASTIFLKIEKNN